jgi:hypothetical protein
VGRGRRSRFTRQYGFVSGTIPDRASGTTRQLVQQVATPRANRLAAAVRALDDESHLVGRERAERRESRPRHSDTGAADNALFDLLVEDVLGAEATSTLGTRRCTGTPPGRCGTTTVTWSW